MIEKIRHGATARIFAAEWIAHRELTHERVAERMDISKATMSKLINGKMKWTTEYLASLAFALGIDVDDLFHDPHKPTQADLLRRAVKNVPADKTDDILKIIRAITGTGS